MGVILARGPRDYGEPWDVRNVGLRIPTKRLVTGDSVYDRLAALGMGFTYMA
jgi:hypothetical protein